MSLASFPVELIQQIVGNVGDFPALVSFSQTCSAVRNVTLDNEALWKQACYRAGFSKSLLHEKKSWRELAAAINHHGSSCALCSVLYDVNDNAKLPKDFTTPGVAVLPNASKFTQLNALLTQKQFCDGPVQLSVMYWGENIDARVSVDKQGGDLMFDEENPEGRLKNHVTAASTLAFDMPIKHSTTCTISDVPFGMSPEDGMPFNADLMSEEELDD